MLFHVSNCWRDYCKCLPLDADSDWFTSEGLNVKIIFDNLYNCNASILFCHIGKDFKVLLIILVFQKDFLPNQNFVLLNIATSIQGSARCTKLECGPTICIIIPLVIHTSSGTLRGTS